MPARPSQISSMQEFSQLSEFLRTAVADEEAQQMGDSMSALADHAQAMTRQIRVGIARQDWAALLMDFLTELRQHKAFVVALSPGWRGLYEYPNYLNALNNFRVLIGQWLLHIAEPESDEPTAPPGLTDFEPMVWRTIGEGMLLIDMYQELAQRTEPGSVLGELDDTRLARAKTWWERLRGS
ncbi:MAG: hypothetical protein ACKVIH_04745 [Burkholderiales bacterium]